MKKKNAGVVSLRVVSHDNYKRVVSELLAYKARERGSGVVFEGLCVSKCVRRDVVRDGRLCSCSTRGADVALELIVNLPCLVPINDRKSAFYVYAYVYRA